MALCRSCKVAEEIKATSLDPTFPWRKINRVQLTTLKDAAIIFRTHHTDPDCDNAKKE